MFFFRSRRWVTTSIIFLVIATICDLSYNRISYAPRRSSVNLGGGLCRLTGAIQDVPEETETTFFKTLVAGYPSGDKRQTFIQMEGLTGLSTKDEWDFKYLGLTNHPFVKANYPHHEGIDGWAGVELGQVALVVKNIKRSMVEYHDILYNIGYAQTYEEATLAKDGLFEDLATVEEFIKWRNLRLFDEIHWYSWFIDYYMEGGLMRDVFSHEMTTQKHWDKLIKPHYHSKEELRYANFVSDPTTVTPTYDPMCMTIDSGCYPVRVISGEKLLDYDAGPAEGRKIAELIWGKEGFDDWMIDEEAWECIWSKIVIERQGLNTFADRVASLDISYTFTYEMENEMWYELDRLINKYDGQSDEVAKDLVELLREHQGLLGITPDESRRLTYEELMTYHLAFPPFFPEQVDPENFWADPFYPHQKLFGSNHPSAVPSSMPSISHIPTRRPIRYHRVLENTDVMGPGSGAEHEMKNVTKDDFVLSAEERKEHVVSNENSEFELHGLKETDNTAPRAVYDGRMGMTREDIAAHFRKADEILHQRRLERFEQINSMKGLYGV